VSDNFFIASKVKPQKKSHDLFDTKANGKVLGGEAGFCGLSETSVLGFGGSVGLAVGVCWVRGTS
jgi:hypothetical protein